MKQSNLWVLVGLVLLILIVGFYFYWQSAAPTAEEAAEESLEAVQKASETIDKVTPTVEVPEVNPVEKANPFKKTYKNPFE